MSTRGVALLAPLLASLALPAGSRAQDPRPPAGPAATGPVTPALGQPKLSVDLGTAAAITGAELGLSGLTVLFKKQLVAPTCRWCDPPQFDVWARRQLLWKDTTSASTASDAFQVLTPAGALTFLWIQAAPRGRREVTEDLVVLAESVSTCMLLTQVVKFAVERQRQDAWARGRSASPDDKLSFWSGHASSAFASAAAATQIARLRGRSGWKWLAAATFSAAALTGYLRVAAGRHWTTDVVSGAVAGTATGLVVPLLAFQPAGEPTPAVTLFPAPGGLMLIF